MKELGSVQHIRVENGLATITRSGEEPDTIDLLTEAGRREFQHQTDFLGFGVLAILNLQASNPEHPLIALFSEAATIASDTTGLDIYRLPETLLQALAKHKGDAIEFQI